MVSSENSRIFMWKAFREWRSALEDMFGDILNAELETKVRQNAESIKYWDEQMTCEELIGQPMDSIVTDNKIDEFRQRYSHIRAYHACRTADVSGYYERGILPLCTEAQADRFRSIFPRDKFPELTEDMLQQSIKKISVGIDRELYLVIDDRQIIERAGHYLIYGSEYLTKLVTQLPIENSQEKYFPVLRKIGKPTFIEINLPNTTEYVSYGFIEVVIRYMITRWFYAIAHPRMESCIFGPDILLNKPILPEHVCSHYHPRKITDPLMRNKIYDAETGEYAKMVQ